MLRCLSRMVLIVLGTLCAHQAAAQRQLTANTLALDEAAGRPRATLADLSLLVGHWEGEFLGGTAEELWLPPAGGAMLGVFRLHRGGSVVFYEIMIAVEEEAGVSIKLKHFNPDLKGWEEKDRMATFRFVKASEDALWFEGLTFRKLEDGSLRGFIAVRQKDGSAKEESFLYRPVTGR